MTLRLKKSKIFSFVVESIYTCLTVEICPKMRVKIVSVKFSTVIDVHQIGPRSHRVRTVFDFCLSKIVRIGKVSRLKAGWPDEMRPIRYIYTNNEIVSPFVARHQLEKILSLRATPIGKKPYRCRATPIGKNPIAVARHRLEKILSLSRDNDFRFSCERPYKPLMGL
jgi:hypothetical protein